MSLPIPLTPALNWHEARRGSERYRLKRLIRQCFAEAHDAHIHQFLPRLFGLWQEDTPLAAVGMRRADGARLFQEGYLEVPAEVCLSRLLATPVSRAGLAEIGNLASRHHGLQRRLLIHLIDQLAGEGLTWVLFTAIAPVVNGIRRLGIDLLPLCLADPGRLGAGHHEWGRYYDHHPWVMAGDLQGARQRLETAGLLPTLGSGGPPCHP